MSGTNSGGYSSSELRAELEGPAANGNGATANRKPAASTQDAVAARLRDFGSAAGAQASRAWRGTTSALSRGAQSAGSLFSNGVRGSSDYAAVAASEEEAAADGVASTRRRRKWRQRHPCVCRTIATIGALVLLAIITSAVLVTHFVRVTIKPLSPEMQKRILDTALLLRGPDSIAVRDISDDGVRVAVTGQLGMDPDAALDMWLGKKEDVSAWQRWDRHWIEWVLNDLQAIKVKVGEVRVSEPDWRIDIPEQELDLFANKTKDGDKELEQKVVPEPSDDHEPLDFLSFHIDPLLIPIPPLMRAEGGKPTNRTRDTLHPISLELLFKPATPAEQIIAFANASLTRKRVTLDLRIDSLHAVGMDASDLDAEAISKMTDGEGEVIRTRGAATLVQLKEGEIRKRFTQKIPKIDNSTDTSKLLELTSYDFFEIGADFAARTVKALLAPRALGIRAHAVAQNPLGDILRGRVPYSLPFAAFLPTSPPEGSVPAPPEDGSGEEPSALRKHKKPSKGGKDEEKPQPGSDEGLVLLAVIAADPFDLTGEDEVKLELLGRVVPPPQDALPSAEEEALAQSEQLPLYRSSGGVPARVAEDNPAQRALSDFLSKFLRGDPNTVMVHGGNPYLEPGTNVSTAPGGEDELPGGGSILPGWLDNSLRQLRLPISFPGSKVTDLIQNVSISDLKIHPHPFEREKLLCDGTVTGVIDLPGQLATIDIQITDLWPDIVVYNGKPPGMRHGDGDDDDEGDAVATSTKKDPQDPPEPEPAPPLPSPLPKHAFGRVRPHDFTAAETVLDPSDPLGQRKLLRCALRNVPFEVLPGRNADFRSFSWKIITGEGALAGIDGSARVKIWNSGLGKLELRNLPVSGAFVVGKRGGDDGGGGGGGGGGGDDDSDDDRW